MRSEQDTKELLKKIATDELKRIQYLYSQGYTEREVENKLKAEGFIIEHDQREAQRYGYYKYQIEAQYYGWGATIYRNLYLH